jgi:uncharacterized protein (DUF1800 family)
VTTTILTPEDRHFALRFSGGLTPSLAADVRADGGGRRWFLRQLHPAKIADAPGDEVDRWFPAAHFTPQQIFDRQVNGRESSWEVMNDLSRWTVLRRVRSNRQLRELMVDFWSNLVNVPLRNDQAVFFRVSYDQMIRKHALRDFASILQGAAEHPAMGLYLNNAVSSKANPNENLGRELMELHTVGVGYHTEPDVKAAAKLLTGYRVRFGSSLGPFYDTSWHYTGPLTILGWSNPNADSDGRAATRSFLRYLAHHPQTAHRIATRLCQRFVSDEPSADLVATVAQAYLDHGTAVKPTLLAMVDHPEFLASKGAKVRTPMEDYIATVRALGLKFQRPRDGNSFVKAYLWQYMALGDAPYEWPSPDGYPEVSSGWATAGRVLQSLDVHRTLAGAWWPTSRVTYRDPTKWLPPLPSRLGHVIDHMSRELLGRGATSAIKQGVALSIGMDPSRRVTSGDLWDGRVRTLVASLLDSPTHAYR